MLGPSITAVGSYIVLDLAGSLLARALEHQLLAPSTAQVLDLDLHPGSNILQLYSCMYLAVPRSSRILVTSTAVCEHVLDLVQ